MDVNLYLTVAFSLGLFSIVVTAIQLMVCEYPRKEERTIGSEVIKLLIVIGFFVWVNILQTVNWVIS